MAGNNGPKIVTSGLVLALDAADRKSYSGSGTAWNDLSGNGNNGTLTNGPTFNSANGGSIVFDGSNDYVTCGSSITQTFTNFSAEAIFKVGITNKKQAIFSTFDGANGGYGLEILDNTNSNKFNWFGFTNGSTFGSVMSVSSATLNSLYNVTVVFQGSISFQIYINGILNNSSVASIASITKGAAAAFQLGDDPSVGNSLYFQGNIHSLKVYNRALSATEVLQNFNATRGRFGI